jgi:hypothetical protein
MKKARLYIILLFILLSHTIYAQNFDKIGKKGMAKVSGGVNFNTVTYAQQGKILPSREPFTWFANGRVNISFLDVSLPFTYTYSNQGGKYTQPFNQTALHPSFKWVKAHIGNISMNFSPYTLSGRVFLGGGVELTPGKWKVKLMGGRLNKAIAYNIQDNNINQITYKRWGYGLNVSYSNKGYTGEVTLFKANDVKKSLSIIPLNTEVKPQDNFVASVKGKARIIKNLNLSAEYAWSGLTQNTNNLNPIDEGQKTLFINSIIDANSTTEYFNAIKTSLAYKLKFMSFSFNFEHVDPGYKTLGGYYFNNDLENYTFAPTFSLLKRKLNLNFNTGYQVNNLSDNKLSTTKRWVGSVNVNYAPFKVLNLTASYSNFSTYTRNRINTDPFYYQPADTLNFYQLSQNATASLNYSFGQEKRKSAIQLMYNYQESYNMIGSILDAMAFGVNVENITTPSNVHASNLTYSIQLPEKQVSMTFATNANYTSYLTTQSLFIGPTINLKKSLFDKKSSLSFGSTYNQQFKSGEIVSNVFNHRISFTYTPKIENKKAGKINLSLNANLLQSLPTISSVLKINELNIFINIAYSF